MPPPPADDQPRPDGMTGAEYRARCHQDLRAAYRTVWTALPREARPALRHLRVQLDTYYTNRSLDDDERLWERILTHFPDQAEALQGTRDHLLGCVDPTLHGVCPTCGTAAEWIQYLTPDTASRAALAALLDSLQPPARQLLAEQIGPLWAELAAPQMNYDHAS